MYTYISKNLRQNTPAMKESWPRTKMGCVKYEIRIGGQSLQAAIDEINNNDNDDHCKTLFFYLNVM